MVYGASGYTARLVMERLRMRGVEFTVAGRDATRIAQVARHWGVPATVFGLDDVRAVEAALRGTDILLNAAGPFGRTTAPLVRGCLGVGAHYLDVSGEVSSLSLLEKLDGAARALNVMLLPAVGFDVVASDCLAVYLARRLPGARELTLSIRGANLISRGSARTFADYAGVPVRVRKEGVLEPISYRMQCRWVDFGDGYRPSVAVSWGDLVTAFHSTRIPNIEVYFEATPPRALGVAASQLGGWMFRSERTRAWFRSAADRVAEGPTVSERAQDRARIVGEVRRGRRRARAVLATSEVYSFTGEAAARVVEQVQGGAVRPGFQTPGALLGPDFALQVGASRQDIS